MKQNKQKGSVDMWFIIVFIIMWVIGWNLQVAETDIKRLKKHDTCLTQAITVNPDPNDTTERTLLLENCMDK